MNTKVFIPDEILFSGLIDADGSLIALKFLLEDVLGDESIENFDYQMSRVDDNNSILKHLIITTPTRQIKLVRMAHVDYFVEQPINVVR